MKVIIVGGVAGGATAAARLRRLDEKAQIIIFERSGFISYANCGLPYYIGGTIKNQSDLALQTPDTFWDEFRIDARVRHEVMSIDRENKTVTVKGLDSGKVYEESYDKLILSTGAMPIKPKLPGISNSKIYALRTVEDTLTIRKELVGKDIKSAVVIGGGFIGVEMAENLRELGMEVSLVEKQEQILGQLDRDMVSFVHFHIKAKGINLLLGSGVEGFKDIPEGISVLVENREPIKTDIVILALGVMPDSNLAEAAGLELGLKGSIAVNEHMQTSDADIYAVGDAVEIINSVTGLKAMISLAGPASKQGRIAADNISGIESTYGGSAASSILKVFDLTVASTGINERTANAAGILYEKIILSPSSHAAYYPGGNIMTMKVLFDKQTETILGAQIVGFEGVDKRIDVLATAMQAGMTVTQLKDLDLAYAPPYSSAKDPVNMAGFLAENVTSGKVRQFFYEDMETLPHDGSIIRLDVRSDDEYKRGYAEGFNKHIPIYDLRERLDELDKEKKIYVMCHSGLRSYTACRILSQEGYDCYNFAGGYRFYRSVKKDYFS